MNGLERIALEFGRQKQLPSRTREQDDEMDNGELAMAATVYATPSDRRMFDTFGIPKDWPWSLDAWEPETNDRVAELAKAGALLAAEIDRILRARGDAEAG
ncbi:hypothetical protein SH467x_002531 [Pirellulaceae bacterium SH467]